jgi:cellulose synthase/poly-beta-1,6-N-acetylglucosamine synthase-like glycosyltransferase
VTLLEAVFLVAAAGLVYVYAGYPAVVLALSKLRPKPVAQAPCEPSISIVIAAHNEAAHIAATIENKLALDYPAAKRQIIVVSDGSLDGTDAIVERYVARGVRFLRQEPRNGKTAALNLAVRHATGELLVFADANSMYGVKALRQIARNFADPTVGYVTGRLVYVNADGTMTGDGCTAYMRYENFIRRAESRQGSVVGVNGGIDAVRRCLYTPMHADDLPDLVLPLRVIASGHRVVYDPDALLMERTNTNSKDEYRMRVRVALRALWTLWEMPEVLDVRRYGFYAVQIISHKVLRYLAWVLGAAVFVSGALLWPAGAAYRALFFAQALFCLCAGLGFLAERAGRPNRWLSVPYYFILVNAAALQAFVKFVRGERARVWRPRLG